jgi:hypothetical protein
MTYDTEKRASPRHPVWMPVEVRQGELQVIGITRNISANGMLLACWAPLQADQAVQLRLAPPGLKRVYEVDGTVVHLPSAGAEPQDSKWQYHAGVRVEHMPPDILHSAFRS